MISNSIENRIIFQGIIETKLKLSDIPKVTELCLAISAKYSNFSEQMAGEFKKVLPVKKSDKIANVAKLRVDIMLDCINKTVFI